MFTFDFGKPYSILIQPWIAFGTDGVLMFSHGSPFAKEADPKFEVYKF